MKKISIILLFSIMLLPVFSESIEILEKKLSETNGNKKTVILIKLLEEYIEINLNEAEVYFEQIKNSLINTNEPDLKIDIYNSIALFLFYKEKYNESIEYIEESILLSKKIENMSKQAISLMIYGRNLIALNKNKLALKKFNMGLELIGESDNFLLIGKLNLYIGSIYINKSEYNKAKKYYLNSLSIFTSLKNEKYEALANRMIGSVYNSMSDYSLALEFFYKSLKYYEKSNYIERYASLLNNMGVLQSDIGNSKKGLELYLKAKEIIKGSGYKSLESLLLNNIGTIYQDMGSLDKSLKYYSEALKIERARDNKLGIAIDLFNIGSIYIEKMQLIEAKKYIVESLKLSSQIEDKTGVVLSYISLAQIKKIQNNFKQALKFLQRAENEVKTIDSKELVKNIYEEYSYVFTAKHNYIKSIEYYNKTKKINNELLSKKSSKKLFEMRTRYETEKKEHEIKNLKYNHTLKDYELNKKDLQKNIFFISFIIVLFIIILLFRQYRLKNTSNRLIQSKNTELESAYKSLVLVASTDPLTKLSNRRDVLKKISYELERMKRYKRSFAIIIGDIDDFKLINDTYGHDAGDEILVSLSKILKNSVRKQDTVSRWGGEEFLIFMPETDIIGGKVLAEKIRKIIETETFTYQNKNLNISLTFGVGEFNEGMDLNQCIKNADNALYKGKKAGKNCVVID